VALLLIAVISVNASYTVLIPFVQDLQDRVGAGSMVIAATFALFAAAKTLAQPVGGWWVDRWLPGHVAVFALMACALGIALTALARDPVLLLTGRIVWGVGEGVVSPALYAGMSVLCRHYEIPASRMMGNFGSASVVGILLGPLVAGVAAPIGLEGLFLAGAAITVVTAFGLLYAIPGSDPAPGVEELAAGDPEPATGGADALGSAMASRWWMWVLVFGGLDMFTFAIYSALEPVLPLYLSSRSDTSVRDVISVVFVAGLATSGLSIWALARWIGQIPLVSLVMIGLALLSTGLAGIAVSAQVLPVVAAFVVFMVGYSLLFLTARRGILELKAANAHQGKAFGLFGMVSDVGNVLGPLAGVLLYELSGRMSFVLLGVLSGLFIPFLVVVQRRGRPLPTQSASFNPDSQQTLNCTLGGKADAPAPG
jgi:MFS family permease